MKTSAIFPSIFRLLLIATIGAGLGLSTWRLIIVLGWNRDTARIANWIVLLLPILSLAWVVSIIVCFALLRTPSTRSLGIKWLVTTLTLWVCTTLIVVGVFYSYGTAYPYGTTAPTVMDTINLVGGAAYIASALSFGFILAPMLIIRAVLFARNKSVATRVE